MTVHKHHIIRSLLMILLLALLGSSLIAQGDMGQMRFVHVIAGASSVDVYTDGNITVSNLAFGESSDYINVPAGTHTLTITPTGIASTSLWEQEITVNADQVQNFVASSANELGFTSFGDNLDVIEFGNSRFQIINALSSDVDVTLSDGTPIAPGMAAGSSVGTFDIPANIYSINVLPVGGSEALATMDLSLVAGLSNTLIIYGSDVSPEFLLARATTRSTEDSGYVNLIHIGQAAPTVDVFFNDILIAPGLKSGDAISAIPFPVGSYAVSIQASGEEVLSTTLEIASNQLTNLAVLGAGEDLSLNTYLVSNDLSSISETQSQSQLINGIPEADQVAVRLINDDSSEVDLVKEVAFGESGDSASFDPVEAPVMLVVNIDDTVGKIDTGSNTFYGGNIYTIIALPGNDFSGPSLLYLPSNINQGLNSSPNTGQTVTVGSTTPDNTTVATPAPEVVVETTAEPVATQAPVVSTTSLPTARVLLDPGANLQLRQYPSPEALSLGLAPSGTILSVNGREGAPVYPEGVEPPADQEEWVDPAASLDPENAQADLLPEETWLNVTYNTPDGGTITSWVSALYVSVRNPQGNLMKLKDLPMVPSNQPGEAIATSITSPSERKDRITVIVGGLNQGANLNLRRYATTEAEILAQVSNGTVLEFLGLLELEEEQSKEDVKWAYVQYLPAEGGTITGWTSTTFLTYEYNGKSTDLTEIEQRNLLTYYPIDTAGSIGGSVFGVTGPTPDPLKNAYVAEIVLDEGANLHLRRQADPASESLDLIPSGTQVLVVGRSALSDWLEVEFEGQTGYISAQYVVLTYNGNQVDILSVPVFETSDLLEPELTETPENSG